MKVKPTVHLLRHGQTLCRMPDPPRDWPSDHVWAGDAQAKEVTCPECTRQLETGRLSSEKKP